MDPVEDPHMLERVFHFRFLVIVCEIGKDVFKALFTSYVHAAGLSLKDFMADAQTKLKNLGILQKQQIDMLFPISGDEPEIRRFDIMLLYTLIRHLGPQRGEKIWGTSTQPVPSNTTVPALVERVRLFKDVISGTGTDPKMNKPAFDDNAEKIYKVFQELQKTIAPPTATLNLDDRFAGVQGLNAVEPRKEEGYLSLLNEWTDQARTERKQSRENHFRCLIIVCEIGKDVFKELFTSFITGSTLQVFLDTPKRRKKIRKLQLKKVINKDQYNLLYPPTPPGHEPDMEEMDVTLLYTLIRTFDPHRSRNYHFNEDPPASNTTVPADVERVRSCRNHLSHNKLYMSNETFRDNTSNLYDVYKRFLNLFPESKRAIEDLTKRFETAMSEPLDTDREERYLKHVKEWSELTEKLNQVQSALAEIKDTLRSKIEFTESVLDLFEADGFGYFVETESYKKAKTIFGEKRCVVIVGYPGAGKTYAASCIALTYRHENPTSVVLKPDSPNDVKEWPFKRLGCLLFLDDFCGKDDLQKGDLVDWKRSFEDLVPFVGDKKLSLVVTIRKAVFHKLLENLFQYDKMSKVFDDSVCVTLSTLSKFEKEKFVEKYFSSVDAELAAKIVRSPEANIVGFPFLCQFARNELQDEKISSLFNKPSDILQYIDGVIKAQTSPHVALVVALCQNGKINNNPNDPSQIETVRKIASIFKLELDVSDVIKQCKHVTDHLFTEEPEQFKIVHDSVSDAVFRMFFQRSNEAAIDMSPLSYVTNCIDRNVFPLITQRFEKEIESNRKASVLEISQGCIWEKEEFFSGFFKDLTADMKDAFLLAFCKTGNLCIVKLLHGKRLYVPLEHACRYGHKDIVDYVLSQCGISADECKSLLLTACGNGRNELVVHLVTNHPMFKEVPMVDIVKKAASYCNTDVLAKLLYILLEQKHATSVCDLLAQESSMKLLHDAVAGDNTGTFEYLAEKGCRIVELTDDGETVLHCACSAGMLNMTKYIIDNFGRELTDKWTTSGRSCLHEAIKSSLEVLEYLLETCNFDPNQKSQDGFSILHLACQNKQLTMVQYLVDKYPSLLNTKDNQGKTCMFHAAASGDVDTFRHLVRKDMRVTEVDCNGRTVLHEACWWGQLDMVKHLLSNYETLTDIYDSTGRSYLLDAIDREHSSILKHVLSQGWDILSHLDMYVFMRGASVLNAKMVLKSLMEFNMTTAIHTFLGAAYRERKVKIIKLAIRQCPEECKRFRILGTSENMIWPLYITSFECNQIETDISLLLLLLSSYKYE